MGACAETETKERLFEAKLAQARATLLSRRPGQRFESLALIDEAARLADELRLPVHRLGELRNATVSALALPDLYPEPGWGRSIPVTSDFDVDERFALLARIDASGNCVVGQAQGDGQELIISPPSSARLHTPVLSRDGKHLAVADTHQRVHLWELDGAEARLIHTFEDVYWIDFRPIAGWSHVATQKATSQLANCPAGDSSIPSPPMG